MLVARCWLRVVTLLVVGFGCVLLGVLCWVVGCGLLVDVCWLLVDCLWFSVAVGVLRVAGVVVDCCLMVVAG